MCVGEIRMLRRVHQLLVVEAKIKDGILKICGYNDNLGVI